MKTHIKQLLLTYKTLVDNIEIRQNDLFNQSNVYPLDVRDEEEYRCENMAMLKIYNLVISDLEKLLA